VGLVWPLRWWLLASAVLGASTIGASVGLMGAAGWLIATAALHPPLADLQIAVVGVRFFGVSRGVLRYVERLLSHEATFKLLARLRVWFIRALAPLAPARLMDRPIGDLVDRAFLDIETLQDFTIRVLSPALVALIVGFGVGGFLAWISVAAAVVFALFYLMAAVLLPTVSWATASGEGARLTGARAGVAEALLDFVQGMSELLVNDSDRVFRKTIQERRRELARVERRAAAADALTLGIGILLAHLATVGVLWVCIPLVRAGEITGVTMAVLCLVTVAAFEAATPLPQAARQLHRQVASATRLLEILDAPAEIAEPERATVPSGALSAGNGLSPFSEQAGRRAPSIVFEAVSHVYPGGDRPAVADLDLEVDAGAKVAVVGPTGAGKSTLAHLVQRFWDPRAGRILLGGTDIRQIGLDDLRRSIGVVSQRTFLFSGTIADNLRIALPAARREQLERACCLAALDTSDEALPDGLDTWIGELGQRLSAGQRQRLSVARTLLRQPPILILDEPTAQLDGPTARLLLERLFESFEDATTIHITHRLVGMVRYDNIIVLDGGQQVQKGTHADLLSQDGLYRRLWQSQRDAW
jgi:ATP-binding cassette subfamily C protein CydC